MSDSDSTDNPPIHQLADLNVATVRRDNAAVDELISGLESEAAELRKEKEDLEAAVDSEKERADTAEELIKKFHDSRREEELARIREANEAVDEDDRVDIAALEEASVDQLETVADLLEVTAGTSAEVSNDEPDLGTVEGGEKTLEDELAEKAEGWGLGRSYQRLVNGEIPTGESHESDDVSTMADAQPPAAGFSRGANGDVPIDDIMETLEVNE